MQPGLEHDTSDGKSMKMQCSTMMHKHGQDSGDIGAKRFHTSSTLLSGWPDALPCSLTWSAMFFSACLEASASRGCFSSSPKMEGKKSGRMRPSTRLASVIAGNPFFLQQEEKAPLCCVHVGYSGNTATAVCFHSYLFLHHSSAMICCCNGQMVACC